MLCSGVGGELWCVVLWCVVVCGSVWRCVVVCGDVLYRTVLHYLYHAVLF